MVAAAKARATAEATAVATARADAAAFAQAWPAPEGSVNNRFKRDRHSVVTTVAWWEAAEKYVACDECNIPWTVT